MRRDSESLTLHQLPVCAIGQPAVFVVDVRGVGIPTYRTTSHVLNIEDMGPAD